MDGKEYDDYKMRVNLYIYTLCMILGMIGVPAMCFAWSAWYELVLEISLKKWVHNLFAVSAVSYAISSLYLIAMDCLPPVLFQNAVELGLSVENGLALTQRVQQPFILPIVVFFLMEDIGISVVVWNLILSGKLCLSKWALLCCPVPMLLIDVVLKLIPTAITKNLSVTMESFGWLLFMMAGYLHQKRKGG